MKKFFFLMICLSCCSLLKAQEIIQVNNNPGAIADFSDLQTAIDAAQEGDLIYLYGSGQGYGSADINKPISIIGTGYFLDDNPETQVDKSVAQTNVITIAPGTENVLITGIRINSLVLDGVINSIIQRNWIYTRIILDNSSAITINANFFDAESTGSSFPVIAIEENNTNIIISNNILEASSAPGLRINNSSNAQVLQNVFLDSTRGFNGFYQYNVFSSGFGNGHPETDDVHNNTLEYNIFTNDPGPVPSTNKTEVDPDIIFAGIPNSTNFSQDARYQLLLPNSPAIDIGPGGRDAGAFDGIQSYVLSGIPFIPNIFELEVPAQGTSGSGIEVTIKVKANKM